MLLWGKDFSGWGKRKVQRFFFVVWGSCYNLLLGRTRSRGRCLSSQSIVSSSRIIRSCSPRGVRCIEHLRTEWSTVCSSAPHSQAAKGHTPFVQAGAETSNTSAEAVMQDPVCSWKGHSRRVGADVRDESKESRGVVQSLCILSVIRPVRHTSDVVVRWSDELLCGGYKQTGVSIWNAVHSTRWSRWALSGVGVPAPWHGALETVWLLCDEAQQVVYLRG